MSYTNVLIGHVSSVDVLLVAVCCSVLQCGAVCCRALQGVAECCSVLQCVAVCCSVLQCIARCCSVLQFVTSHLRMRFSVYYSVLQFHSVSQCVTLCCSVLQVPRLTRGCDFQPLPSPHTCQVSHVTFIKESRHTIEWATSHI